MGISNQTLLLQTSSCSGKPVGPLPTTTLTPLLCLLCFLTWPTAQRLPLVPWACPPRIARTRSAHPVALNFLVFTHPSQARPLPHPAPQLTLQPADESRPDGCNEPQVPPRTGTLWLCPWHLGLGAWHCRAWGPSRRIGPIPGGRKSNQTSPSLGVSSLYKENSGSRQGSPARGRGQPQGPRWPLASASSPPSKPRADGTTGV